MTCIVCNSDVKMLDSPLGSNTWLLSCEKCGQYEITPAVIVELPKDQGWLSWRARLSRALRWWHDSHGKPYRLVRIKRDLSALMIEYDKAQESSEIK